MKKTFAIAILLLMTLSPMASALVWLDPYWMENGQSQGTHVSITDGETAVVASGTFYSDDDWVSFRADLMNASQDDPDPFIKNLALTNVDLRTVSGFETVEVSPADYLGPGNYLVVFTLEDNDGHGPYTDFVTLTVLPNGNPTYECNDGLDNDGDGQIDFPTDLGCDSPSDDDESNDPVTECNDGQDNDGDGLVDMADPGCDNPSDDDEYNEPATQCNDGVDNDGDGLVDMSDPGCDSPSDDDEYNYVYPECADGLDNDGDGLIDWPVDPGCDDAFDDDETDSQLPECDDGLDNDGDGLIDMIDPGCDSPSDDDESSNTAPCYATIAFQNSQGIDYLLEVGRSANGHMYTPAGWELHTLEAATQYDHNIRLNDIFVVSHGDITRVLAYDGIDLANDIVYFLDLGSNSQISAQYSGFDTSSPAGQLNVGGYSYDFYVSSGYRHPLAIDLNDDGQVDGGVSTMFDCEGGVCAPITLDLTCSYECDDGLDNDADGLTDLADPGCESLTDDDETNVNTCPVADFDWSPQTPQAGQAVTFTSTSTDADNDALTYSWDFNNDGIPDSNIEAPQYAFNSAGNHAVSLVVHDGECSDDVAHVVTVEPSCILDVLEVDCLSPVIEGELASCTVDINANGAWLGGTTVDLFDADTHQYLGFCYTDSMTGACNAQFQAPAPGTYTVYATAQRNGCVADLDTDPQDTFDVYEAGYQIAGLSIYNTPGYDQEDYDFFRAQDMFVRFNVLDEFNNPVDNAVTSVELLSPPGGHAYFTPYDHSQSAPGRYDYWLQVPSTHEFLGQSQVFVFQFNFQDGSGAQRVVGVNIHNNDPEIAEEGYISMGAPLELLAHTVNDGYTITLNVVDPVDLTATFMVDGETVGPIMEGYSTTLSDGMTFHAHDIDFDNNAAVVSITAHDYLLSEVFTSQPLLSAKDIHLADFKSDVEDSGNDLSWAVSDVDPALFTGQWTGVDTLQMTPLGVVGCDDMTLTLTDLDGAVDTFDFTMCAGQQQLTQCADGLDNDNDGWTDMDDPGCSSPSDDDESDDPFVPACSDGLDNDGDGLVDLADPGCTDANDDDEYNMLPQCSDGFDNDNDGLVDLADPGCTDASDDDEYNTYPQCMDGIDNDNDGLIDMNDPGCTDPSDDDEYDEPLTQCNDGLDNDNDGLVDLMDPGCESVHDDDETNSMMPQCADNLDNDGDGLVDYPNDPGCAAAGDNDESDNPVQTQCNDGLDNDGDGLVDLDDPGCTDAADNDEWNLPLPQCSDGIDNDGDGLVDMADPDCTSPLDDTEEDTTPAQCQDGLDNDADGLVDMADPGCSSATDDDEFNLPDTQCTDGLDNDGDGLVDLQDPGCSSIYDDSEYNWDTQCSDEIDNDGDGLVDMYDPDCTSPEDNSEYPGVTECNDGIDNDGDGAIDLADLHCYDIYDEHEGVYYMPDEPDVFIDRDDLLVTRIDIDGHDVEAQTVEPGQDVWFSVSVENTLDHDLDDVHVRAFIDAYGLWATKTIHKLDAGERYTANMHIAVPYDLDSDLYDLRVTASSDDVRRVKYRHLLIV